MLLGLLYMNSTLTTHKAMNTLQPMLKVGLLKKKKNYCQPENSAFYNTKRRNPIHLS